MIPWTFPTLLPIVFLPFLLFQSMDKGPGSGSVPTQNPSLFLPREAQNKLQLSGRFTTPWLPQPRQDTLQESEFWSVYPSRYRFVWQPGHSLRVRLHGLQLVWVETWNIDGKVLNLLWKITTTPVWEDSGGTRRESSIALTTFFFLPHWYAKHAWTTNSGINEKKSLTRTKGLEKPTTHLTRPLRPLLEKPFARKFWMIPHEAFIIWTQKLLPTKVF